MNELRRKHLVCFAMLFDCQAYEGIVLNIVKHHSQVCSQSGTDLLELAEEEKEFVLLAESRP